MYEPMDSVEYQHQLYHTITLIKPQLFNFDTGKHSKPSRHEYKPGPAHLTSREQSDLETWKPRIQSKKTWDDPKLVISMERKKLRVINGIRRSEVGVGETARKEFRTDRPKIRKQTGPSPSRASTAEQQPHPTQACLNYRTIDEYRCKQVRTPFLNFNLHHLIRQRKHYSASQHHRKKGSNQPYKVLLKQEIRNKSRRMDQLEGAFHNPDISKRIRTARQSLHPGITHRSTLKSSANKGWCSIEYERTQ